MADDQTFISNIAHLSRGLQTAFDAHLKSMGLTAARGRVLFYLSKHPEGANQADVTDFLRVEHPTAVRILDGLEGLGYIKRLPAPTDRRAKIIALTEMGTPIANRVVRMTKRLDDILMRDVDPTELDCARKVLRKVLGNLDDLHASAEAEAIS